MENNNLVKQLLLASSGYWTLNKVLVRELGLEPAFLLSNLAEAEQMLADEDGWFYQTISTVEKVTTLSRHKQETAIEELKRLGVLDIKVKGLPPKRHFRLNYNKIAVIIENSTTNKNAKNSQIKKQKRDISICEKLAPNKEHINKELSIKELNNIYIDNSKEKESQITEEEKKIQSIYEEWKKANIINHRRITRAMKTKIKSALKDYTEEEIKQSIRNYSYIVNNDNYFFSHRWTLDQFCTITQKDRIGNFLDLEVAKNNYRANKGDIGNGGNERHNIKNEDDSRKEYEEFEAEYFEKWKI